MRVWIVMGYEPLPGIDENVRPLRCGILAQLLAAAGHQVTWWTGTLDHSRKEQRYPHDHTVLVKPGLQVNLLHGPRYQRNVSLRRIWYNREVARAFSRQARAAERPDIIFTVIPTVELASAAVGYARRNDVPIVIDAQDKWPDLYANALPRATRALARLILSSEYRRVRIALRHATSITAVSESYLTWALHHAGRERRSSDCVFPLGFSRPASSPGELESAMRHAQRTFDIRADGLVLTYLGQFGSSYDLETVIGAARVLQERGVERVQFLLAGDGDKASLLRRAAAGTRNVTFCGWLDQTVGFAVLRLSSAGLAAYRAQAPQSLPYKPFDYIGAGLPILSSLGGEFARLVDAEQIGVNYEPGDAEALAAAVERLLANPSELDAMRRRVRVLAPQFDAATIYPRLLHFLLSTAASPGEQHARSASIG